MPKAKSQSFESFWGLFSHLQRWCLWGEGLKPQVYYFSHTFPLPLSLLSSLSSFFFSSPSSSSSTGSSFLSFFLSYRLTSVRRGRYISWWWWWSNGWEILLKEKQIGASPKIFQLGAGKGTWEWKEDGSLQSEKWEGHVDIVKGVPLAVKWPWKKVGEWP